MSNFVECCKERIQHSAFFCLEVVARGLDGVSNNRLKGADVPGIPSRCYTVVLTCLKRKSIILSLSTFKYFQKSFSELWHSDCVNNGVNKRVCVV